MSRGLFVRDAKGRIDGTTQFSRFDCRPAPNMRMAVSISRCDRCASRPRPASLRPCPAANETHHDAFPASPDRRRTIDFKPYVYGPPTVTLAGRSRKRAVDHFYPRFSNSMSELTRHGRTRRRAANSAARSGKNRSARHALGIGDRGRCPRRRHLLGHRVGWNLKSPIKRFRQTDYPRAPSRMTSPSEDVESVLPLGPLRFGLRRWSVQP